MVALDHLVVTNERVRVRVDRTGRPFAIGVDQRLVVLGKGDYVFSIPAPVRDVVAGRGSESTPGQRLATIVWSGFNPGRKVLAANARLTTNIETEDDIRLHNAAVSTIVSSDVPVIAERSMYWPGAVLPWAEGHNSFGVGGSGTKWGLAEGRTGGPFNYHTYVLLANPQATPANVTATFLRELGAPVVKTYTVLPTSRFNIDSFAIPELHDESFGVVIEVTNAVPIIVERSL